MNNQDKINWDFLSQNPSAINILSQNLDKVNWIMLSKNQDKIYWAELSSNSSAIELTKAPKYFLILYNSLNYYFIVYLNNKII